MNKMIRMIMMMVTRHHYDNGHGHDDGEQFNGEHKLIIARAMTAMTMVSIATSTMLISTMLARMSMIMAMT